MFDRRVKLFQPRQFSSEKLLKTEIPQGSNKDVTQCPCRNLPHTKMSFQWSIQPMLTWMRYTGVYLDEPGIPSSTRTRCLVTSFGLVVFFFSVCRNGFLMVHIVQYLTDPKNFMDNQRQAGYATIWNSVIASINEIVMIFFSQSLLMSAAATKWPSLVQVLLQMEGAKFFEPREYERFRLFFTGGLVWLCTGFIFLFLIMVVPVLLGNTASLFDILWHIITPLLHIYVLNGSILFVCLSWMASEMLNILAKRIEASEQQSESGCKVNWNSLMDTWRHQNYRISQLVDGINSFCGPFLLLAITFCFVMTINTSFNLMVGVREGIGIIHCLVNCIALIINFAWFSLTVYSSHCVRQSAIIFSKQLRALRNIPYGIQTKANLFVLEVLNSLPNITAIGIFDINLHLIPALIGTTLTYLIILCQFEYSEKK